MLALTLALIAAGVLARFWPRHTSDKLAELCRPLDRGQP